jgi:succinyl-diaminopimelate desuccinylase
VSATIDPVALSQRLVRCESVTPHDAGALSLLQDVLESLGFVCHPLDFGESCVIKNLYARLGEEGPNFCFAGHTDVVPPGAPNDWTHPPFAAEISGDRLYGRGVVDMKGAIACFVAAVSRLLAAHKNEIPGSISLLITGDEEGDAIDGTRKVLEWLVEKGESLDVCLVGEPTNATVLGDTIKIGRRGSLNGRLTVTGTQGHTAYPQLADNPIPRLMKMLDAISETPLDDGTEHFQPSNVEITIIDVDNPAANVIPSSAEGRFNVRFNDHHTSESLSAWMNERCEEVGGAFDLKVTVSGEAFITQPGVLSDLIANSVKQVCGETPELNCAGGTSDARFIKDVCPVAEFGLINETAHKIDENARLTDIESLSEIYLKVLEGYFRIGAEQ